jgi:eukaryotic-like serine/threonine-protein kinase
LNIDVGQIIAGKYELVRLLGKGAMGEVWLATHNSLGGEFAIKLVEPTDDIEAETAAGRFQLEAQIAAKLSRKTRHIVSVSDHGEEDGLAYLVMELLEGESLEARTKRMGQLNLPEVAAIVNQVARALLLAHEEGIFHRDLKPANVWLGKDEDGRMLVKLLDFGIARSRKPFKTRSPFATSKDMVLGTPSYMSPEQARGLDSLDYRCDLWALGVVAYEALTKKIPFEGETVEDIFLSICTFRVVPALTRRPDLPQVVETFFQRAFAPKLEERYATAAEFTENFEMLVSPEELEQALGIPKPPISARRVGSNPNLGSNPDLRAAAVAAGVAQAMPGPPPPPSSNPLPPQRPPSQPDYPNNAAAYGDPMSVPLPINTAAIPKNRSATLGVLIAVFALIALLGGVALVVINVKGRGTTTTSTQPTDSTTQPPSTTSVSSVLTNPPSSATTGEPPPPTTKATTTTANTKPGAIPTHHGGAAVTTVAPPTTAPPPPPTTHAVVPPTPPASHPPTPPTPTKPAGSRSDVF